jgi:hypothetical protein
MFPITPEHTLPFQTVAMDFITKLPKSGKYDTLLTITDHDCSKAVILIPCQETVTAEGVAALYMRYVFPRFGAPKKVISDRDTRLTSKFARALCAALGVHQNISTAYHPRTDGQSERSNQWVEQFLRFFCDERQDDWHTWLSFAEFVSRFVSDWSCFASVSYGLPLGPSLFILSYSPHACCLVAVMWCTL